MSSSSSARDGNSSSFFPSGFLAAAWRALRSVSNTGEGSSAGPEADTNVMTKKGNESAGASGVVRRSLHPAYPQQDVEEDFGLIPILASSSSGDTTTAAGGGDYHHKYSRRAAADGTGGANINNHHTSPAAASRRRAVDATSMTPEGLRPRPSMDEIRSELQLPMPDDDSMQYQPGRSPPRQHQKTLRSVGSSACSGMPSSCSSPPISGSGSFYYSSRRMAGFTTTTTDKHNHSHFNIDDGIQSPFSSSHLVAESPVLLPGRARTAVGALLATSSRHRQTDAPAATEVSPPQPYTNNSNRDDSMLTHQTILPPHCYNYHHHDNHRYRRYGEEEEGYEVVVGETGYLHDDKYCRHPTDDPKATAGNGGRDLVLDSRTPPPPLRHNYHQSPQRDQRQKQRHRGEVDDAAATASLSSPYEAASPSSLVREKDRRSNTYNNEEGRPFRVTQVEPVVLWTKEHHQHDVGTEAILSASPAGANQELFRQQEHSSGRGVRRDEHYLIEGDGGIGSFMDKYAPSCDSASTGVPLPSDSDLLQRKVRNQSATKREVFYALLERLQDDPQLISQVEAVEHLARDDWCRNTKTPLDREGIVTGFSGPMRNKILMRLGGILGEMDLAQPEDFFLSPSEAPQFATKHDCLRESLLFCRRLVELAVPPADRESSSNSNSSNNGITNPSKEGKWKFMPAMRAAMGIVLPESPEASGRFGGDTSQFSLPNDETPMTSNVSVGTTITTARTASSSSHLIPCRISGGRGGLELRRCLERGIALLQTLSSACLHLGEIDYKKSIDNGDDSNSSAPAFASVEDCLRIMEEIKRAYTRAMELDLADMKAAVESFELELPPTYGIVSRQVSTEEDEADGGGTMRPSSIRPTINRSGIRTGYGCGYRTYRRDREQRNYDGEIVEVVDDNDIVGDGYDDLRRQFGSDDRDDEPSDEMRDPPPLPGGIANQL